MSEELELTPKLNCGVWTAIENFLNKENTDMIWDNKNVPPTITRKKERVRIRKFVPPVIPTHQSVSSRQESTRPASPLSATALANAFAHKTLILRNKRNQRSEEVFERSKQLLESCNIPVIDCSFNLPRVNAQLERLMGSNVVHLTDRKYMTELRRRISDDFENMLIGRIYQREQEEIERQMKLVLYGLYSARNVPNNLVSAHSVVLAEEVQRQRVLLMEGKLPKCPKELRNHPVLVMNESTNNFVIKRRAKLKTERERVAERMVRLGKKWEAEHLLWEEKERQKEAEMKIKELEMLSSDKEFARTLESKNLRNRKDLAKYFNKGEMNMVDFIAKETALMVNRLKSKEKKFVPFTKDIRVVDAKRRLSEVSISKLKLIAAKVRDSETTSTLEDDTFDDADAEEDDGQTGGASEVKPKKNKGMGILSFLKSKFSKTKDLPSSPSYKSDSEDSPNNLRSKGALVDPVITELKNAKNVKDLYHVAEKIVGVNIETVLVQHKSEAEEQAT